MDAASHQPGRHRRQFHVQHECAGRHEILPYLPRAVSAVSGEPDQFRVVGDSLAGGEIPILRVPKAGDMAVEKNKLRAAAVQVRVNKICFTDGG